MRRHSKTGDARAKARLTTRARKQTKAPKGGRRTPLPGQKAEIARLSRELLEAHEQQRATSEILDVVARSRTDIQSVLDNVCQSAAQLCEAYDAAIWQPEGERLLLVAHHGPITQTKSVPLVRGSVLGSSILDKRTVHIADLQTGADEFPVTSELARRFGFRTGLYVPLIRESVAIGVIALRRAETQRFTERQVALLQTFANQAVIAIENARLLNELRQRTDDLTELLEQQTATSEVLRVISASPGELVPVFNAMLENATRICDAKFGTLFRFDGEAFDAIATLHHTPQAHAEVRRRPIVVRDVHPDTPLARVAQTKETIQVPDMRQAQCYLDRDPQISALVETTGVRALLVVPMLKEGGLVGAFVIFRQEVRPFTDKQIELVQNFAAQAVIAIENTRLLNELRESLQQQTATADVLKVISSSPGELEPVFQAMLENATRICEAEFGILHLRENDAMRTGAVHNAPAALPRGHCRARTIISSRPVERHWTRDCDETDGSHFGLCRG